MCVLFSASRIRYEITSGNIGGAFAVKNMTGAIYVAGALDYETRKRVSLDYWLEFHFSFRDCLWGERMNTKTVTSGRNVLLTVSSRQMFPLNYFSTVVIARTCCTQQYIFPCTPCMVMYISGVLRYNFQVPHYPNTSRIVFYCCTYNIGARNSAVRWSTELRAVAGSFTDGIIFH
jgi:hypothetical protein